MTITHEQKADVGQKYVAQVKERIATRAKLQKEAAVMDLGDGTPALREFAKATAATYGFTSPISEASVTTFGGYENRVYALHMRFNDNTGLYVPVDKVAGLKAAQKAAHEAKNKAHTLCTEIQFLTDMLGKVAAFQAYVARLWAPGSKTAMIGEDKLKQFMNDYFQAERPAVCAL